MDKISHVTAKITGINYTPFLCRKLNTYSFDELQTALNREGTFILKINEKNQIAVTSSVP